MATDKEAAARTAELVDLLFTVMPMVADHINDRVEDLGMTATDYWALRSVDGPMPMKDLATCMDIDPSYVTVVADRLEKLGLIERQPHPVDRRIKNLIPTAKGQKFKKTVPDKLWGGPSTFSSLTSAERSQLIELLTKVAVTGRDDPAHLQPRPLPAHSRRYRMASPSGRAGL